MEKEQILKGNKLIAESELSPIVISSQFKAIDSSRFFIPKKWYYPNVGYYNDDSLLFHSSWDWLIPVVEKIAKIQPKDESIIHNGEDSYLDNYYPRTFGMINSETKDFMVRINRFGLYQSKSLIEATFLAVVAFIEWYNQHPINQNTETK